MNTAKGKTDYVGSSHRRNHDEYVGKVYNRWKILRILPELSANGSVLCEVQCSCKDHTISTALLAKVRSGETKSCGCLARELSSERGTIDLTGRVFDDLTVMYKVEGKKASDGSNIWMCRCKCGNMREVPSAWLIRGATKSCGECALKKTVAAVKAANTKFTPTENLLNHRFNGMYKRCYDERDDSYHRYGARGIKICDEWLNDVAKFREWAMNNGFSPELSIERIDNDGPYAPWNCRWATPQEQSDNRSVSIKIPFGGKLLTTGECGELARMSPTDVHRRKDDMPDILAGIFKRDLTDRDVEIARYRRDMQRFVDKFDIKM